MSCRTALRVVDAVRQARPDQPVEVVDLAEVADQPLPPGVVGTPTYLLGQRVISMGNPELNELLEQLDTASESVEDKLPDAFTRQPC
ncbi:hypothetical protein GCM10025762_00250 [Haloechinothrix salitolerans]